MALINTIHGVNVKSQPFGALGDGTGNDASAIQAAACAAHTERLPLYFPPGNYRITSTIDFSNWPNVEILGSGAGYPINLSPSNIMVAGPIFGFLFGSDFQHRGPHVQDLQFWNEDGAALGGIHCQNINHGRFERVSFGNFTTGRAMLLDGPEYCVEHMLMGVQVRNCKIGVDAQNTTALTMLGGMFVGSFISGSVGVITSETSCIVGTAFDGWDIGVEVIGDSNYIRARFENNTTAVKITTGRRNHVTGCMFNQATVGVHLVGGPRQFANQIGYNDYSDVVTPILNQTQPYLHFVIHEPSIGLMETYYGAAGQHVASTLINAREANNEGAFWRTVAQQTGATARYGSDATGTAEGAFMGAESDHRAYVLTNNKIAAYFERVGAIANGHTALVVMRDLNGVETLQPVSMGAAGSGGAGFRLLRVPN